MEQEGISLDDVVLVSGIGCHAKIADYLNINSFYALHGRTIPVATGITLGNPRLTVICCTGDGDSYAEGLDHLIFAAKRNIDITGCTDLLQGNILLHQPLGSKENPPPRVLRNIRSIPSN